MFDRLLARIPGTRRYREQHRAMDAKLLELGAALRGPKPTWEEAERAVERIRKRIRTDDH